MNTLDTKQAPVWINIRFIRIMVQLLIKTIRLLFKDRKYSANKALKTNRKSTTRSWLYNTARMCQSIIKVKIFIHFRKIITCFTKRKMILSKLCKTIYQ